MKFFIEAVGFGRGLGVLDINKDGIASCYMLNPDILNESKKKEIYTAFDKLLNKEIESVESELSDPDWISFNKTVLKSFGIESYYDNIVRSLVSLRKIRHTANE